MTTLGNGNKSLWILESGREEILNFEAEFLLAFFVLDASYLKKFSRNWM